MCILSDPIPSHDGTRGFICLTIVPWPISVLLSVHCGARVVRMLVELGRAWFQGRIYQSGEAWWLPDLPVGEIHAPRAASAIAGGDGRTRRMSDRERRRSRARSVFFTWSWTARGPVSWTVYVRTKAM